MGRRQNCEEIIRKKSMGDGERRLREDWVLHGGEVKKIHGARVPEAFGDQHSLLEISCHLLCSAGPPLPRPPVIQ